MKIANLGTLSGPVIAYGGALGNLAALGALLREATRAGVPGARVISTGDIVGPCASSAECIAATRAFGGPVVAGDLERALAAGLSGAAEVLPAGGGDGPRAAAWWQVALAQVDADARDWLEDLPDIAVFAHEGRRVAVLHGGLTDPARTLWPTAPDAAFAGEIRALEAAAGPVDMVLAGHAGLAFERLVGGVHWVNAGMIGLPSHDGRPGGRYVQLSRDGARILRLSYDPMPAFTAMVTAGLTQGFDVSLMSGLWPSDAGLPAEMRGR